jgi:hypothetical protein
VRIVYGDTNSRPLWSGAGKVVRPSRARGTPTSACSPTCEHAGRRDDAPAKPKVDLRKSALDYALADTARCACACGATDARLLDSYQDSLRDIERRLRLAACRRRWAARRPCWAAPIDVKAESNYPHIGKLQMDMMVAALQCNLTRVASLQWGNSNDQCSYSFLGVNTLGHDMAHNNNNCDPATAKKLKVYKWYSRAGGLPVNKLNSIPEGTGTMLDNNGGAVGVGVQRVEWSQSNKLMWFLMGNAGGYFKNGQVLNCAGRSTNDVHASLCNAFGIADRTFGNPAYCAGPLPGLT